jgi:hypothetical protein
VGRWQTELGEHPGIDIAAQTRLRNTASFAGGG